MAPFFNKELEANKVFEDIKTGYTKTKTQAAVSQELCGFLRTLIGSIVETVSTKMCLKRTIACGPIDGELLLVDMFISAAQGLMVGHACRMQCVFMMT